MPFAFDRPEDTPEQRDQAFNANWRANQSTSMADAAVAAQDVTPRVDPSGANQSVAWQTSVLSLLTP